MLRSNPGISIKSMSNFKDTRREMILKAAALKGIKGL
jgi:hypothetical protein